MKILQLEVGSLGTNCYILYCETTKKAVVIDPGGDAARILATINREGLSVEAIINTHGHADHVLANTKVKEATGAPLWIHGADADMLGSGARNLSACFPGGFFDFVASRSLCILSPPSVRCQTHGLSSRRRAGFLRSQGEILLHQHIAGGRT